MRFDTPLLSSFNLTLDHILHYRCSREHAIAKPPPTAFRIRRSSVFLLSSSDPLAFTFMASISPVWLLPVPKPLTPNRIPNSHFPPFKPIPPIPYRARRHLLRKSATSLVIEREEEDEKGDEESMGIDALHCFIHLNLGTWNGLFTQYDSHGRLLQSVTTKLAVGSYGEDELISLIQTLYIKQPPSRTSISGHDPEPEWAEYKIKETNMFTVDKYQQIGIFPNEKAFSLRYQTAGMLETVLREGVLGEDDTGEESPRNLKLPSRRPSVVCENCLFSQEKDMRARAFHIMDPRGILEMLLIFLEQRGDGVPLTYQVDISKSATNRLSPLLGQWKGHSITKRSGVYGATIAEAKTVALLDIDDKGQLIQDITSTSTGGSTTNVHWTGRVSDNLIIFDGGFQMTLLPGGMYMGCPCDVGKSVAQSQSFHLEFCWMESLDKRQRLVRTYDVEGLAVSSTYITEVRVQRSL